MSDSHPLPAQGTIVPPSLCPCAPCNMPHISSESLTVLRTPRRRTRRSCMQCDKIAIYEVELKYTSEHSSEFMYLCDACATTTCETCQRLGHTIFACNILYK